MKSYIEAGVAGVHFEDQLASEKKCGHLGGKVLIPTQAAIRNLDAARLAADVSGVPTVLVARTDAESAKLITSDVDERDRQFLTGERTPEILPTEGRHRPRSLHRPGPRLRGPCRSLVVGNQPSQPRRGADLRRGCARPISRQAARLRCSPSFNWAKLDEATIARFQRELGAMGYKFQFVTLAGLQPQPWNVQAGLGLPRPGMAAYSELQQAEFASEADITATRHQREVGTGYFDAIATAISAGEASTVALNESTEARLRMPRTSSQWGDTAWDSVIGYSAANIATAASTKSSPGRRRSPARSPTFTAPAPNGRASASVTASARPLVM